MDIKPIKTDANYEMALKDIERLMDAEPDTPDGDQLEQFPIILNHADGANLAGR